MSSRRSRLWGVPALCAVSGALLGVAAGPAGAATAVHPNGGSGFASGVEGWSASGAACTPVELLCSSKGVHDPTAGSPPGSLAVETSVTLNLLSLFKGTATWTSPEFVVPVSAITGAEVRLDRAFKPGGLVDVGPTAAYTVTLSDLTAGTAVTALSEVLGEGDAAFAPASAPMAVVGGHRYQLSIKADTAQSTAALSLISGTAKVGFDNIGIAVTSASGGGPGDGGGDGRDNRSSSSLTDRRLFGLLRGGAASRPAVLKGNRLFVKVNCPSRVGRACRIAAQGMLNRRKPATAKRVVKVGKGKGRQIVLRVKPNLRKKVAKRKRLLVRQVVRAGGAKATYFKQRKLIRR